MKTAFVIGATGLIGKLVTQKLLNDAAYSTVTILVRNSLEITHPKLTEIKIDFDELYKVGIKADDVYCCMGTTIKKARTKENFKKIDYTYVLNAAKIAKKNNCSQFIVVTAMGANSNSIFFYNRVKGDLEKDLMFLNFNKLLIIRPSLLIGNRLNESRVFEKYAGTFLSSFSYLLPKKSRAIKASKVANAMVEIAKINEEKFKVIHSDMLQLY